SNSGARSTVAPQATPIAWCPRQTPSIGVLVSAQRRTTSMLCPARSGVPGPGETSTPSNSLIRSMSTTSLRQTVQSAPNWARYCATSSTVETSTRRSTTKEFSDCRLGRLLHRHPIERQQRLDPREDHEHQQRNDPQHQHYGQRESRGERAGQVPPDPAVHLPLPDRPQ